MNAFSIFDCRLPIEIGIENKQSQIKNLKSQMEH